MLFNYFINLKLPAMTKDSFFFRYIMSGILITKKSIEPNTSTKILGKKLKKCNAVKVIMANQLPFNKRVLIVSTDK